MLLHNICVTFHFSLPPVISIDGVQCMVCHFRTRCFHFCFFTLVWTVVVNLKSEKTRGETIIMISMLNWCKYSRTFANGHLALYNGHFFFAPADKKSIHWLFFKTSQQRPSLYLSIVFQNPLHFIWQQALIERFHMTSLSPYGCTKTTQRRPCWCSKPILLVLNLFLM